MPKLELTATRFNLNNMTVTITLTASGMQSPYDGYRRVAGQFGTASVEGSLGYNGSNVSTGTVEFTFSVQYSKSYSYSFITEYCNSNSTEWNNANMNCRGTYTSPSNNSSGGSWNGSSGGQTGGTSPGSSGTGTVGGGGTTTRPYIEPFYWESTVYRQSSYSAAAYGRSTKEFYADVWNQIVDKVNQLIIAYGGNWSNMYQVIGATRMTAYDKTLTATRYNSLAYNIWVYNAAHYTGETVFGSYIIALVDQLNNGINNYNSGY